MEQRRPAVGLGRRAEGVDLGGRRVATERRAAGQHLAGDLGVALEPAELADRRAVPVEPEPAQAGVDRLGRLGGRAGAVGVLDPQQELAAGVPGVEPVEQRGAGAADMEIAGRRGREARDDGRVGGHAINLLETTVSLRLWS